MSVVPHARETIRQQVIKLAARRGVDASGLGDSDVLPETGVLDSVAIMELIIWFESTFDRSVDQSELTLDNFGSVDAMVYYLEHCE
jgi:D-alanine--poly(phosphoribitol) ligase subunit 2